MCICEPDNGIEAERASAGADDEAAAQRLHHFDDRLLGARQGYGRNSCADCVIQICGGARCCAAN